MLTFEWTELMQPLDPTSIWFCREDWASQRERERARRGVYGSRINANMNYLSTCRSFHKGKRGNNSKHSISIDVGCVRAPANTHENVCDFQIKLMFFMQNFDKFERMYEVFPCKNLRISETRSLFNGYSYGCHLSSRILPKRRCVVFTSEFYEHKNRPIFHWHDLFCIRCESWTLRRMLAGEWTLKDSTCAENNRHANEAASTLCGAYVLVNAMSCIQMLGFSLHQIHINCLLVPLI